MLDDCCNRLLPGLEEAARFRDVILYDPDLVGLILGYGRHILYYQYRPISLEGDQLSSGSLFCPRAPQVDHLGSLWLALQALNAALQVLHLPLQEHVPGEEADHEQGRRPEGEAAGS